MKPGIGSWLFVLVACAGVACGGKGSYRLIIEFPDDVARLSTARLLVWALGTDAGACEELVAADVYPDELTVLQRLVFDDPVGRRAQLRQVPNGEVMFFAEGRTDTEARILRGCKVAEVKSGDTVEVIVTLDWVCHPDPAGEIPGNGIDDDCDDLTDECVTKDDCKDGNSCRMGDCINDACYYVNFPDDLPCDDGNPCTADDACLLGECIGTPKDCSALNGPCTRGECDPQGGGCVPEPRDDGTTCDDGLYCTADDACTVGVCGGAARDCADGDDCTRDTCNEVEDRCDNILEHKPGDEGPEGDATCSDGEDNDCDGLTDAGDPNCMMCNLDADCNDGNSCTQDLCNGGVCENTVLPNGTACSDGLFCTAGDTCTSGVCTGGPRDCSSLSDACHDGVCMESSGNCQAQSKPDGTVCDDGWYCTVADACASGACGGAARDCDDGNSCTADTCDEAADGCSNVLQEIPGAEGADPTCQNGLDDDCDGLTDLDDPNCGGCTQDSDCNDDNPCTQDNCSGGTCLNDTAPMDGTDCNDGLYCTVNDACAGGICTGGPRDCSHLSDACNHGTCMEASTSCQAQPKPDGTNCNDGLYCTVPDSCTAGACGGTARDCDDGDHCTADSCNEGNTSCDHAFQEIPGAEGPDADDPTCWNGVDDDCDGLTDYDGGDPDCCWPDCYDYECGPDPDCPGAGSCGECAAGETCLQIWVGGLFPGSVCFEGEWKPVTAGTFDMGSPDTEDGRDADEFQHQVQLTHDFEIWSLEVTRRLFNWTLGYESDCTFGTCEYYWPVDYITWHEAAAFCNALSWIPFQSQLCYTCDIPVDKDVTCVPVYSNPYDCPGFRLPTEAEWEYAARAGVGTATYNGDLDPVIIDSCDDIDPVLDTIAWYCANSGNPATPQPVGTKGRNPWGLYDMLGNVWEWCHDGYGDYVGLPPTDPFRPPSDTYQVARGGSIASPPFNCRAAARHDLFEPGVRYPKMGVRCVRTLAPGR